ncbi:hypothetical protein CIB48_g2510 [Xylaria polymorpha]|nr:hypothetical protein CIB48_g2510 [Xylaria polymorpha]
MRYSFVIASSGLLAMSPTAPRVTAAATAAALKQTPVSFETGSWARARLVRWAERKAMAPSTPAVMIASFMDGAGAPTNKGAASSSGVEDDLSGLKGASQNKRGVFGDLLGGLTGGGAGGNKGTKSEKPAEDSVAAAAGQGASSGLPTCSDDGSITMTFRQINQDGAGPLKADVDGTSGGADVDAFKTAEVTQDVPGLPIGGLSLATNTDFPVTVQMPAGMTCDATVADVENVCIVRVRNGAAAGPFGGSAAFTQSPAARKRAIAYRLKKRAQEEKYQNRRLR